MAMIGRKEQPTPPASSTTQPRDQVKTRPVASGPGATETKTRTGRLQRNISDIRSELVKVTWPTRDETRNLTIVVIGISAVVGALLATLDVVLSFIYNLINGTTI